MLAQGIGPQSLCPPMAGTRSGPNALGTCARIGISLSHPMGEGARRVGEGLQADSNRHGERWGDLARKIPLGCQSAHARAKGYTKGGLMSAKIQSSFGDQADPANNS